MGIKVIECKLSYIIAQYRYQIQNLEDEEDTPMNPIGFASPGEKDEDKEND